MVRYRVRHLAALACFICLTIILPRRHIQYNVELDEDHLPKPDKIWSQSECPAGLKHYRLLLVVRSQVQRRDNRNHVRKQIQERSNCSVQALFLFGQFNGRTKAQMDGRVRVENETFGQGDVVQVDFEMDYRLKGVVMVEAVRKYLRSRVKCTRFDQVMFGKYDIPYASIQKDMRRPVYAANWELDDCLKYAHTYDNSVHFTSTYFVPRDGLRGIVWTPTENMDPTFVYQNEVVTPHEYSIMLGDETTCGSTPSNGKKILFVIAAHTAPGNFINRKKIRETWGAKMSLQTFEARLIFFTGHQPSLPEANKMRLAQESQTYNDIVQVDFLDSYKNMTLKQISILKFLSKTCRHVSYSYLLKTDDDIVIDLKSLHAYFTVAIPSTRIKPKRTIFCAHMNAPATVPRYQGKWFVSRTDYPAAVYPAYCSGAGYLITQDLVADLYHTSLHVRTLWVDDTFVSGILTKAAGDVALVQLPKQHLIPVYDIQKKQKDLDNVRKMFVHVGQDMDEFDRFWWVLQGRRNGIERNENVTTDLDE